MLKRLASFFFANLLFTTIVLAEQGSLKLNVFPAPPNLSATVKFSEPSGNNILDADEMGKITITLKNIGEGDAFDVKAEIRAGKNVEGLSFERDVLIGTVPAGQTVQKEIELKATEGIATENINLTVVVNEANGFDPAPMKISFPSKAFEPPKLVVADMGINDQNGNGRVEPMEMVEVTVRVQNIGHGDARNVSADIQLGKNVFIAGDSVTHFELGSIPSGIVRDFKFMLYTNNRIENGEKVPVTIQLGEVRPRFNTHQPLTLVMNAPQKKIEEVIVKGDDMGRKADIVLAGGLSVDVDTNIPEGQKAGRYDIAVVIGNRNYAASGSPNVEFAQRDARIMNEYLIRTLGYDPANIIYVEDAPLSKFNEIFGTEGDHKGKLFKWVKKGISRVFVYYVGHGAPDLESTEAYFMPVDATPDYIKSNGYRLQTFYDNLSKVPARKMTIVLDACFSGSSEKGLLFKNISPAMVKVKKELRGPKNAVVITSTSVDQVSTWYPEKKHSLFTYYFLKGLQGNADINKDRKITVGEMQKYLKENVPYMAQRLSGKEQQPVVMGNEEDMMVVLRKLGGQE
jgi:hypothetical protein